MNINVTLPNVVPLTVHPPTEDARRDNIQRPQIIPPQELASNPNSTQISADSDHARAAAQAAQKSVSGSHNQQHEGSHQRVEGKSSQSNQQSFSGQQGQEEGDPQERSNAFRQVNLDALLSRAKASQKKDREFYHRAPPGAPSTPEEVKAMRFRNQVISARYESSYQEAPKPGLTVTI